METWLIITLVVFGICIIIGFFGDMYIKKQNVTREALKQKIGVTPETTETKETPAVETPANETLEQPVTVPIEEPIQTNSSLGQPVVVPLTETIQQMPINPPIEQPAVVSAIEPIQPVPTPIMPDTEEIGNMF